MRLAVISDIHGNYPALEAVLDDARRAGVDGWLIAGDLLARAPFPLEVLQALQSLDPGCTFMIRGNGDQYQVDYAALLDSPTEDAHAAAANRYGPQYGIVRWTHELIGPAGVDDLAALPEERTVDLPVEHLANGTRIHMVHASPGSLFRGLVPDRNPSALQLFRAAGIWTSDSTPEPLETFLNGTAGTPDQPALLICGHTHIAWQQWAGHTLIVNPGAVGMPINGDRRAQYALLGWGRGGWQVDLRAVDYDYESLRRAYHQRGLLEAGGAFARGFLATALTGQNVAWFYLEQAAALASGPGGKPSFQIPRWAFDEAERTFPWAEYGV